MLRRKALPLSREGKNTWRNRTKNVLKRDANFSLEIHIFFSRGKNVNRLRKIRVFQVPFISLIINKIIFPFKTGAYRSGSGTYGKGKGRGEGEAAWEGR